ncbi:MAG: DUF4363 family protein [Desulfitobacterium sp.]|nr:DUF4363 family protein [Desulfitobacterium sp.]
MLRTYLTAAIIFIVLIFGSIWYNKYLSETTTSLDEKLLVIGQEIQLKNWENTNILLKKFEDEWNEEKKICNLLLDHSQIDNIDITLERLKSYVTSQDEVLSLGEVATLRLYFNRIRDIEKISIENLL